MQINNAADVDATPFSALTDTQQTHTYTHNTCKNLHKHNAAKQTTLWQQKQTNKVRLKLRMLKKVYKEVEQVPGKRCILIDWIKAVKCVYKILLLHLITLKTLTMKMKSILSLDVFHR